MGIATVARKIEEAEAMGYECVYIKQLKKWVKEHDEGEAYPLTSTAPPPISVPYKLSCRFSNHLNRNGECFECTRVRL